MAKKLQRTKEQQEYRDNLAHNVKNLRKYWDTWKDLAKTLLEKEKVTIDYLLSIWEDRKKWRVKVKNMVINYTVISDIEFEWLNHNEIAKKLIEKWYGD